MKIGTKKLLVFIIVIIIFVSILVIRSPIMFGSTGIVTKCNNFELYDISKAKVHNNKKEKNLYVLNLSFKNIYVYRDEDGAPPKLTKAKRILPILWKIQNNGAMRYTIVSGENKYYYIYLYN